MIVNGSAGKPETANVAPLTVSPVIVTLTPTAVRVPVWEELLVPSGTEPKLKLAELMVRPAPVPERVADGVFEALLVKDRLPELTPVTDGAKPTLKPMLCPAGIVTGRVSPLMRNPALSESEVRVTSPPLALKVADCKVLVTPRLTVPKLKLVGVIESVPTAAVTFRAMALEVTPLCAAVMLLDPTPAPVASPAALIVATVVFVELQVAKFVKF